MEVMREADVGLSVWDISGTTTSTTYGQALDRKRNGAMERLHKIMELVGLRKMVLSFSTGYYSWFLFRHLEQFAPYLEKAGVELGLQYAWDGAYDLSGRKVFSFVKENENTGREELVDIYKALEVARQIRFLQEENDIKWVGFADDGLELMDLAALAEAFPEGPMIYGFKPSKYVETRTSDILSSVNRSGLDGLLMSMDNYIDPTVLKVTEKQEALSRLMAMDDSDRPCLTLSAEQRYNIKTL